MSKSTLTFYGGAGEVTGANIMLDVGTAKILVDCGLHQGEQFDQEEKDRTSFKYDTSSVDMLLVTHAHTDHIGRIPLLVKSGFKGEIYSTEQTRQLSEIILADAVSIFESQEAKTGAAPLYGIQDVEAALRLWKTVEFHEKLPLPGGCEAVFSPVGHILGAATISVSKAGKKILFTGDIGNSPDVLLPDPEPIHDATYLVTESVYGDRLHDDRNIRTVKLRDEIVGTEQRSGTLLIPSFAVHRAQILLREIRELFKKGQAPVMPVFLDSPLASKATDIYKASQDLFNEEIKNEAHRGEDIFSFSQLTYVKTSKESAHIAELHGPKIIIAGSGMSVGGRIISHETSLLEDRKTTILFVGFQAPGTLGRRIQEGQKRIKIGDRYVSVRAKVAIIHGYSGHADRNQLQAFAENSAKTLKQVFVIMGEMKASSYLAQRLNDDLGLPTVVPEQDQSFEIEF